MTTKTNILADILLLILIVVWAAIRAAQAAIYSDGLVAGLLGPTLASAALLVVLYLIVGGLRPRARTRIWAFLATAAIGVFCFSYVDSLLPALRYRWQLIAWAAAFCAIMFLQDWLNRGRSRVPVVVAIALLYSSLLLPVIGPMRQGGATQAASTQGETGAPPSGLRSNVYFLMLDAYGRSDVLQGQIGYDNSAFIGGLEKLGFVVGEKSFANYPITTLSVSAMLDMGYPVAPATNALTDIENYTPVYDIITGNSASARFFRGRGYNYVHFWPNGKCDYSVEICPTHQHFFSDATTAFLGLTPLGKFLWLIESRDTGDPLKQRFRQLLAVKPGAAPKEHDLQAVERIIRQLPTDKPYFLFARILPPHPGNSYGENCQYTEAAYTVAKADFDSPRYIADTKCVETDTLALVQKILREDKSRPVIVLQSDHGPEVRGQFEKNVAEWDAEDIIGRYGSLNAIYMAGGCLRRHHYPTISSVNTLRLVSACLAGATPEFIPDISYFATYIGRPGHGMVLQIAKDSEPRKQ